MFRDPLSFLGESGWLLGRPAPWYQFIDPFLWPAIHQAREQVSEIRLRIDAIELTGLCRAPDYAELAPPSRRLPLVCVHIIRHSLTVDRLLTRTWGAAPFSTGTSENARIATLVVHGKPWS